MPSKKENKNHTGSLLAIYGPTAVGKSRIAASAAVELGCEIVSADSMQVYCGLPILTDQPTAELLEKVPHHLIGTVPLEEDYSAGCYQKEATAAIGGIYSRGRIPLLAGGTGLYVRAVLGGLSFAGEGKAAAREKWELLIEERGLEAASEELARLDPEAARVIDRSNPRRVIRALEAFEAGQGLSAAERDRLWSGESEYDVLSFGLIEEREKLYGIINERVDRMLASGALEEVRTVRRGAVSRTASQAIGYREVLRYLDGEITLEEASDIIKQKSRRYAKRQLTWMRKMPDIVRIDLADHSVDSAVEFITSYVDSYGFSTI